MDGFIPTEEGGGRPRELLSILLSRLSHACSRQGWDGDTWSRGIEVLQRKFGVVIYLQSFQPSDMVENESLTATITITPTESSP